MPSDDWRRTSRSDNFLMATVVAPSALICVIAGVGGIIVGVWLPGLGFLVAGCVLAMNVVRQAQRASRANAGPGRDLPSAAAPRSRARRWLMSPLSGVILTVTALTLGAFITASIVGSLPRASGIAAGVVAVSLCLLLMWLSNREQ